MKLISFLISFALTANAFANNKVRRVQVKNDEIVTVRTAVGIATIIQVPDRPNSVVVGDQESFKVEYLDQAITIKPLSAGVKSNLYVYTDWKRYNVELVSGNQSAADYVVYLETPKTKPKSGRPQSSIAWTSFSNTLKNENLTLKVKRIGQMKNDILLIEIVIHSSTKEALRPEWIWLTQNGAMKPIHNLFLSGLELTASSSVSGVLQIKRVDIDSNVPMRLELRKKKNSFMTIMKLDSWKRP